MTIAEDLVAALLKHAQLIAIAESCTGGMVAAAITDVAGASQVFDRGFVTYSDAAKIQMLGVPAKLITAQGAVSQAVALAMAQGALKHSAASLSIAVTGIAGPAGGSETKPLGLVHFACATKRGKEWHEKIIFKGNRTAIRTAARDHALQMLGSALLG